MVWTKAVACKDFKYNYKSSDLEFLFEQFIPGAWKVYNVIAFSNSYIKIVDVDYKLLQ